MTPRRRADGEPRCDRHLWCSLPGGHEGDTCAVIPQEGFQEDFLLCTAAGALGGGAVGAGKSAILLLDALRHVEVPGFTALILRREKTDLERADGLWHKSHQLFPFFGGKPDKSELKWTFKTRSVDSTIQFGHIDPHDWEQQHQGSRACFIGFDELTHFTLEQVLYLISRNGTSCSVPAYWRATCNPDADSWVRRWVDWWIADAGHDGPVIGHPELTGGAPGWPRADRAGVPRYYAAQGGAVVWGGDVDEVLAQVGGLDPEAVQSFTFLPGQLEQNRFQDARYRGKVLAQTQAARWLGWWNAARAVGKAFKRDWFLDATGRIRPDRLVDAAPPGTVWCRAWDLAATPEAECQSWTSHSHTAGPLVGLSPAGDLYIADLDLGRWSAGVVEQVVADAAARDRARFGRVRTHFCREHAGAGKAILDGMVRLLAGHDVEGEPETGDKGARLRPLLAQAEHGHVYFVRPQPDPDRWLTADGRYVLEHVDGAQLVQERPGQPGRAAPGPGGDWIEAWLRHMLSLTISPDGKAVSKPNDVADGMTAAQRVLAGLGRPIAAGDLAAVIEANPILSGGRTGAGPSQPAGRGRFGGALGPGRMRLAPPRPHR